MAATRPARALTALTAAAALIVLAAPSAALAQGAGDQQYQDPFGSSAPAATHKPAKSHTNTTHTSTTPATTAPTSTTPSTTQTLTSAPPSTTTSATTSTANSAKHDPGQALPFTGFDTWAEAALGVGLLLTGIGLRLRFRPRDDWS